MTGLRGPCACGSVRYRTSGALTGPLTFCNRWRCRKRSGSSYGTTAGVAAAAFRVTDGADLLRAWESSPVVRRHFASCCGSPIFKTDEADPAELGFRLGTLDDDPGLGGGMHFQVGSAVPWLRLDDGLPCEGGGPPFGARDADT